MSSNTVKLLGLVISVTIIYICVDLKKDEIAAKLGILKNSTIKEKTVDDKPILQNNIQSQKEQDKNVQTPVNTEKSDAAFGIILGDHTTIVAMFSPSMKKSSLIKYIDTFCQNSSCDNDIRYSDDIKEISWQKDMIELIQLLKESSSNKGSIFVNSNTIKIEANSNNTEFPKRINQLEDKFTEDGLVLLNPHKKNEAKKAEKSVKVPLASAKLEKNEDKKQLSNLEEQNSDTKNGLENQINDLLGKEGILFTKRSNDIKEESKSVLEKVVKLLDKKQDSNIEVISYAKISDDGMLNKIISQKRADIIKKYLQKNGIKVKKSMGMGDKKDTQINIKIN